MDGAAAPSDADLGRACVAWLDHHVLGRPAPPAEPPEGILGWLRDEVLARAEGPLLGLDCAGLDAARFAALRATGAPLSPAGRLRWGREVQERPDSTAPQIVDQRLELPPPERLAACDGVQLKPLRLWFGRRLGLRLQAAPRIASYLWAGQALLVSCREEQLAGFLHGPRPDQRHPLAWRPGEALWLRW